MSSPLKFEISVIHAHAGGGICERRHEGGRGQGGGGKKGLMSSSYIYVSVSTNGRTPISVDLRSIWYDAWSGSPLRCLMNPYVGPERVNFQIRR